MKSVATPIPLANDEHTGQISEPSRLRSPRRVRRWGWAGSLAAFITLMAFTAAVSLVFWPGHMNADSVGEFDDAIKAHYSDWHSAAWSALWHVIIQLGLRSPGWMLAGGVLTMLVGLYLVLRVRLPRPLALLGAALVFVFPPVLSFDIVIGTDAWFAATIICAFGLVARCARTTGRSRAVSAALAVVFAALAQAARPTAAPAVLASLFALALVLLGPRVGGWRRVLGAAVLGIAGTALLVGSLLGLQRTVLHAAELHAEQETYEYDLVALSIQQHRVLLPPEVYPRQDVAWLANYAGSGKVRDISPLLWGTHSAIPTVIEGARLDTLRRSWLAAIRAHPEEYLRLRLREAQWQLAIRGPATTVYYMGPTDGLEYRFTMPFPSLHQRAMAYEAIGTRSLATGGVLQTVWVYVLVLVVASVVWLRRLRPVNIALTLLSVAFLLYTLEILFLTPGVTYRYMYPPVAAATVLFVVLVADVAIWLRVVRRPRQTTPLNQLSGVLGDPDR
jgi:hypothetical protein